MTHRAFQARVGRTRGRRKTRIGTTKSSPNAECYALRRIVPRSVGFSCAPRLHVDFDAQLREYDEAAVAFESETGGHPLTDWQAFEEWLKARGPA